MLWEQVLEGLEAGDGPGAARSILTFAYFWYNFMPLARGTAAAGYIFILSLFLAAGMPVTASIPKASLHSEAAPMRFHRACVPPLVEAFQHLN